MTAYAACRIKDGERTPRAAYEHHPSPTPRQDGLGDRRLPRPRPGSRLSPGGCRRPPVSCRPRRSRLGWSRRTGPRSPSPARAAGRPGGDPSRIANDRGSVRLPEPPDGRSRRAGQQRRRTRPARPVRAESIGSTWRQVFEVDFFAPARLCRLVIPAMRRKGRGKIINVSGGGATGPRPDVSAYSCAKTALVRLTETLAEELKGTGIDVNAVAPGADEHPHARRDPCGRAQPQPGASTPPRWSGHRQAAPRRPRPRS